MPKRPEMTVLSETVGPPVEDSFLPDDVRQTDLPFSLALTLEQRLKKAREVLDTFKDWSPKTQEDLETVAKVLKGVKAQRNEIEVLEQAERKPLNAKLKESSERFKPVKTLWADAEVMLKAKIAAARLLEDERNRKALVAAADAHAAGDAQGVVDALAQGTNVRDIPGISTSKQWTYIIEDESLLPEEFWIRIPNEKLLKEHCAHTKDREPTPVPGVRFVPDVRVAASAGR